MKEQLKEERRALLYGLMGDLPDPSAKIGAELLREEDRGGYLLEHWALDLNGVEPVPAIVAKPKQAAGRRPAILFNHSHGGFYELGKRELTEGNVYMQRPPYAEVLTGMGYVAMAIDMWGFGERSGRTESKLFKHMLWNGQVMWGMMVYDNLRAFEVLRARADVDPDRIGTLGMSMGSTMAWWTAALEPRIRACVDICCLTDFQALIDEDGLDGHGIYYYVPGLLKHFTTAGINALIAPRPHLSLAGIRDPLTPAAGLERIGAELKAVYAAEGAPDAWRLVRDDAAHQETPKMRTAIEAFLREWLD